MTEGKGEGISRRKLLAAGIIGTTAAIGGKKLIDRKILHDEATDWIRGLRREFRQPEYLLKRPFTVTKIFDPTASFPKETAYRVRFPQTTWERLTERVFPMPQGDEDYVIRLSQGYDKLFSYRENCDQEELIGFLKEVLSSKNTDLSSRLAAYQAIHQVVYGGRYRPFPVDPSKPMSRLNQLKEIRKQPELGNRLLKLLQEHKAVLEEDLKLYLKYKDAAKNKQLFEEYYEHQGEPNFAPIVNLMEAMRFVLPLHAKITGRANNLDETQQEEYIKELKRKYSIPKRK